MTVKNTSISPLRFGYNTNGFAHHTLEDALRIIADLGYSGVALTLDVHHLNPFTSTKPRILAVRRLLRRLRLDVIVETGARYLLDPRRKHEPSFISPDGCRKRVGFTKRAVDIAEALGARVVTVHSGASRGEAPRTATRRRLAAGLHSVCDYALKKGIVIGLEPEPDMFVETVADYGRVHRDVGAPNLKMTLDVGHIVCSERDKPVEIITRLADDIVNVHIEDIKYNEHNHLPPGEGDINFAPVLAAFRASGYSGLINVELSRHSHAAPAVARKAIEFFRRFP